MRGLQLIHAPQLDRLSWLTHAFTTCDIAGNGGSLVDGERVFNLGFVEWDTRENVLANRAALLSAMDADAIRLMTLRQLHSDAIHRFEKAVVESPRADAAITQTRGLMFAVQTADCLPILLADTRRRAVAAIHAGWRGTLKRITEKTLGRMRMEFGTRPQDVVAALGPGIRRCCFEVGSEVVQAFHTQFEQAQEWFDGPFDGLASGEDRPPFKWLWMTPPGHDPPPPRAHLDLFAANISQLVNAGVPAAQISSADLCTACLSRESQKGQKRPPDRPRLFSYRREGARTGRLMGVIGIR